MEINNERRNTKRKCEYADIDGYTFEALVHMYNQGYNAGHHDTVEACFSPVLQADIDDYHNDVVQELADNWDDFLIREKT